MMRTSRELIAFAFVEEEYSKTGDLLTAFKPLFIPLLVDSSDRLFDPYNFAHQFEEKYDIPMSGVVAEGLIPKLEEAGLIYEDEDKKRTYRVSPIDTDLIKVNSIEIDRILNDFVEFSKSRITKAGFKAEDAEIENALLKRLVTLKVLTFLDHQNNKINSINEDESERDPKNIERVFDVLCAEYITKLHKASNKDFALISKITEGALISEVVLTFKNPSSLDALKRVNLVIDGPILLDLLGLNKPECKDYADELFDLIDKCGVKKFTFKHLLDEMRGTIYAPLEAIRSGRQPYGWLGTKLIRDTSFTAYARSVLSDLEDILEKKGVEILDSEKYAGTAHLKYCSHDLEDSLRNQLGEQHEQVERRSRDALSIATVLRLRGEYQHPMSFTDANYIFLSRNTAVVEKTRSTLIANNALYTKDIPPAMSGSQIAGILWFALGGSLGKLTQKKLIANCSDVMQPNINLISKMKNTLEKIDSEKVQQLSIIMTDQRAQNCLVHCTVGLPSSISTENVEVIYEEMRRSTLDEVISEYEEKVKEITRNGVSKEGKILTLENEKKELEGSYEKLKAKYNEDIKKRTLDAKKKGVDARKRTKIAILVLYALFVLFTFLYLKPSNIYYLFASCLIAILGFWFVPNMLFGPLLKWVEIKNRKRRAEELNVYEEIKE